MLILIFLNLILLTSALPSPYQYIGCISTASAPPFTPSPIKAPFTAPECLKSCSYTATLIAVGSDSCLCDAGGASASFELVDEARCNAPCTDGGKCGGEGVLSLYQLSGSGCGGDCKARNGTVPPVVPTCNVCDHVKTPIPTPTQTQVVVTSVIYPPEGCRTVIPTPVTTPAGNSTGKPCPSGGCNSNNGGGSQNGSSGSSSGSSGSSGEGSNAAPDLVSDSPELFAPSILPAIAAIIFGICLI